MNRSCRRIVASLAVGLILGGSSAPAPAQAPAAKAKAKAPATSKTKTTKAKVAPPRDAAKAKGGGRGSKTRGRSEIGRMDMWPFPPALIIRQTPENHEEIDSLLRMLRGG